VDWSSSPVTAENETELVRRLRHGNTEGMCELYERYGKLLFALIVNIVGDRLVAEDLLLESLLKASNRVHEFSTDSISATSWLLILARNHALEFRNGDSQNRKMLEAPSMHSMRSADREISFKTEAAIDVFKTLEPEDRLILELAWFEGMTFDEIALRLERPTEDVVASALAALDRLRAC
jgi:RNA polymerase sigma-70 factor, ECF subfamily